MVLALVRRERDTILRQFALHSQHVVFTVVCHGDGFGETLVDAVRQTLRDGRDGLRVDVPVHHVHVHSLQPAALKTRLERRERGILPVFDDFRIVGQDPEFRLHDERVAAHAFHELAADPLALAGAVDLRGVDVVDAVGEEDFPG